MEVAAPAHIACTSFVNVKISDLDFADDSVIFTEMLDILMRAWEVLNEVGAFFFVGDSNNLEGLGFHGVKLIKM